MKWISVKDRLPESNDKIIASTKRSGIVMGRYISFKNPTVWDNIKESQFTHWMPLPAKPE